MKRRLICLAAALGVVLLAACSKESEEQQPTTNKGFEMTLTATIATDTDNTPDTRVAFETGAEGKGLKATWESTDKIIVYLGSLTAENRAIFEYEADENGAVKFTGTLPRTPEVGEKIYAYNYLVNDYYGGDFHNLRYGIYYLQSGSLSGGDGLNKYALLYAEADYSAAGVSLAFHHLYSVFKLTFTFPDVTVETPITNLGLSAASGLYSAASFDATDGYAISSYSTPFATLTAYSKFFYVNENHQVTVYLCTPATTVTNLYGTAMVGSTTYVSEAMVSASVTLQRGKVYAKTITMKPDETIASSFAGGDGSAETPYLITKASEFRYMAQLLNNSETVYNYRDKSYTLANDVYLGDGTTEWTPCNKGTNSYFRGVFDGAGHTIYGSMKIASGYDGGLFAYAAGTIKNLKMNCTVDGTNVAYGCGAIVGRGIGGLNLLNCSNAGSVSSPANSVGGLVGRISNNSTPATPATIVGCTNSGAITCSAPSGEVSVAGICGNAYNAGSIIGCINKGDISYTTGSASPGIGGIVGGLRDVNNIVSTDMLSCWSVAQTISSTTNTNFGGALAGSSAICFISTCYYRSIGGLPMYYNSENATDANCGTITTGDVPSAAQIKAMNDAWAAYDSARAYRFNALTGEVEAVN